MANSMCLWVQWTQHHSLVTTGFCVLPQWSELSSAVISCLIFFIQAHQKLQASGIFFLTGADRSKTKTVGKHRCGGCNITHRSLKLAAVVNWEEEPAGVIGWGFFQSISIPQKCKILSATITETSLCWHHQVFCTDIEETGSLKSHCGYFEFTVNNIGFCKTLYIYRLCIQESPVIRKSIRCQTCCCFAKKKYSGKYWKCILWPFH